MQKKLWLIFRIAATLLVWGLGGYVLYRYEYFTAFGDIDNITGMIPVALILIFTFGLSVIILMKPAKRKQRVPILAMFAASVILSAALFPTALRGNWWINPTVPSTEAESAPDLNGYAPFSEDSKTTKLDELSALKLHDYLPVLDGATALYPVYAAFAEAVYAEDIFLQNIDVVLCTNTRNVYEAIISGERDIIFVAGASDQQIALAEKSGADLRFTPIGREAFVFLTGKDNPIDNLTYQQIRNIYSGKTAYWHTLGWREGGRIIAFQRPENSGSQTGLQNIMGELPIQVPQPLPDADIISTSSLMQQISVEWRGVQPAVGYSYRYYAATMYSNPDVKFLSVDGAEPSMENIRNGSYPFVADFYAVTNGEPEGSVKLLIDWILSPQGQEIIAKTGYTPTR